MRLALLREYFSLAVGSLRKRRLRSWLTMLGIVIGIAAVVSLISLGQGMQKAITEQFFQLGADKVTIQTKGVATGPPGSNTNVQLTKDDLAVVRRVNGVVLALGRLVEPIRVTFNDKERFLYLVSVPDTPEEKALADEVARIAIVAGRGLRVGDGYSAIISEDYVTSPKFDGKALAVGDKVLINGRSVTIVGVFKKTGNPFVDVSFEMQEPAVRELTGWEEKYGMLAAQIDTSQDIPLVVARIEKDLRSFRDVKEGQEDFDVQTAEETLDSFRTILNIVTAVLIGIAGISLIVGGVGITNTMFTAVLERTREIGIMKAIGARNGDIVTIFVFEAGLLGMIGGAIGMLLGMGFGKLVEVVAGAALGTTLIEAHFPWPLIAGSLLFSFGVGTLAGAVPAYNAGRLPPVEALRE